MEFTRADAEKPPYFSNVFMNPQPSLVKVNRLFIDNRDRTRGDPFEFSVQFGGEGGACVTPYEHVKSIELKAISFPKVDNETYVIMRVEEFRDDALESTCTAAHNAYAILYFDNDCLNVGHTRPMKGLDFYQKCAVFNPPISRLNRLTFKFLKHDGSSIVPTETGNVDHVSMIFEVTTGTRCN